MEIRHTHPQNTEEERDEQLKTLHRICMQSLQRREREEGAA